MKERLHDLYPRPQRCAVKTCLDPRVGPVWCLYHASHQLSTSSNPDTLTWSMDGDEPGCDMWCTHNHVTYHIQKAGEFYYYSCHTENGPRAQGRVKALVYAKNMCELFSRAVA